ncbi:hypothetical protein DFH06DRAFT_1484668 [Mycena polygramma]|nr:hypothetical protein DFH06DRAFT_1484668 [Mycena polygramma]
MADDSHGDVNMAENENPLLIPTAYNPPVRGWTEEMVKMNHCDDIVELIEGNPATCMAAVIMSYDVHDRESGPTAIKSILLAEKVADADKVDVFPPTPKEPVGLDGMPYTNIISDCTPAFKAAVLAANSVFYGMHDGVACTFYVFSVKPQTPWTIATFTGLSTLMSTDELKNAAYTCFLNDPSIVQMITANHGNIRDDHGNDVPYMLRTILQFAAIATCTIRRRGGKYGSPPIVAHRVLIPPFSPDAAVNQRFQNYLMSAAFSLHVPRRGKAVPWRGPDPRNPVFMSCRGCYGVDHYSDDCSIINSPEYRTTHDIAPDEPAHSSSSVPTSLTAAATGATANNWEQVPYRGAGRGAGRGGRARGGFFPRGNGRGRDGYRGYNRTPYSGY